MQVIQAMQVIRVRQEIEIIQVMKVMDVMQEILETQVSQVMQVSICTGGGTRLPSECDHLQKNSSLWRLSMNNRHKRECSAVDFAANCHP